MKRYVQFAILFLIACLCVYGYFFFQKKSNLHEKKIVSSPKPVITATPSPKPLLPEDITSILDRNRSVPLDTLPSSYTVLVNRDYLLPAKYTPGDLVEPKIRFSHSEQGDKRKLRKVAAMSLEKMFHDAEKKKMLLYGVSGYRSYERQQYIYQRNISLHGKKSTDTLSAKPGSSEHQTGLAIDISAASVSCMLTQRLSTTREGKWIAKNAHKYGFIIRYPKGKTKITGYSFEPWHIRYVGTTVATYLHKHKLTLEEYYGEYNKSEIKTGVDVEDTKNYGEASPSATPTELPKQ